MEAPDVDQQLIVAGDAVARAADRVRVAGILEALDDLRLHQHREVVAPSRIVERHALAAFGLEQDLVGVEAHQRARLGHDQRPGRRRRGLRGELGRGGKIVDRHVGRVRSAAGHALEPGKDAVDLVGVPRQRAGEGVDVGDGAVQRLGILRRAHRRRAGRRRAPTGSNPVRPEARRCSVGGAPFSDAGSGEGEVPPRSAMAAPPVRPCVSTVTSVSSRIGRVVHDADGRDHVLRPSALSESLGDLADAKAVEQHRRADRQSGHRALEADFDRCPARRSRLCSPANR